MSENTVAVEHDRARLEWWLAVSAIDLGPPGHDPVFGWSLIQAHRRVCCRPRPRCSHSGGL